MFSVGLEIDFPANIYLIKVNNRNTSKRYEICLKLTIKYQKDVNFTPFSSVSSVHFEQINVNWAVTWHGLVKREEFKRKKNDTTF